MSGAHFKVRFFCGGLTEQVAGLRNWQGISATQDARFTDKEKKLLKSMAFPSLFKSKVDLRKVNLQVLRPWISKKVVELLGIEDEVVVEYVYSLLEEETNACDPKRMQIKLTGFLEAKTPEFMTELWTLLLSAQDSLGGIPKEFLEQKKLELQQKREEEERLREGLRRQQEQEREREPPRKSRDASVERHPRRERDRSPSHRRDRRGSSRDRSRDRQRRDRERDRSRSRDRRSHHRRRSIKRDESDERHRHHRRERRSRSPRHRRDHEREDRKRSRSRERSPRREKEGEERRPRSVERPSPHARSKDVSPPANRRSGSPSPPSRQESVDEFGRTRHRRESVSPNDKGRRTRSDSPDSS